MIDLQEIRNQIDEIDDDILKLFEKRMHLTGEVAQFKIETGKQVFDKERELQKLKVLKDKASGDFNAKGVQELFQQIMSISRKRQYQLLTENGVAVKSDFREVKSCRPIRQGSSFRASRGVQLCGDTHIFRRIGGQLSCRDMAGRDGCHRRRKSRVCGSADREFDCRNRSRYL